MDSQYPYRDFNFSLMSPRNNDSTLARKHIIHLGYQIVKLSLPSPIASNHLVVIVVYQRQSRNLHQIAVRQTPGVGQINKHLVKHDLDVIHCIHSFY